MGDDFDASEFFSIVLDEEWLRVCLGSCVLHLRMRMCGRLLVCERNVGSKPKC